ncbi:hypothetical protein ACX27_29670 [Nostoc piscinale CENA21]|uniref:Uncharacterized protein n=1 Tax=Nostoc piscinale CENA21 TaxID=224013 RepID=A0A0M5TIM5_9NOSO|nr:hypothetical protein [Nostoc piscinale]ALF56075.1 hypothetical protein ACX27_29670 [Nostoc piscinale CENA21]
MAQVKKFARLQHFPPSRLQQFLEGEKFNTPVRHLVSENPSPKRERIKHILIGSSQAVSNTIHHLHVVGYASTSDWSPLLPTANPDEVMSILIRMILMR